MDDEKSAVHFRHSHSGQEAQAEARGDPELTRGPSLEEAQSGWREERRRLEEGRVADLTESALPNTLEDAEAELQREHIREATFRRDLERNGPLTEFAVPPPVERVSSWRGDWAALESAESRVTTPPPTVERVAGIEARLSDYATLLYTISYLVFFSILGALARIGLQWLTSYPGAPLITAVTWANVGGCLLMGFLAEDRKLFREEWGQWKRKHPGHESSAPNGHISNPSSHAHLPHPMKQLRRRYSRSHTRQQHPPSERQSRVSEHNDVDSPKEEPVTPPMEPAQSLKIHKSIKKTIPLYIGLTTGFCGSLTSFSTFMLDVFLALANDLPTPGHPESPVPRNGGYSFMAVLAIIIYTLSLSIGALILGSHLAIFMDKYTPVIPYIFSRRYVDPFISFLAMGSWLGAVFLAIWPPDRSLGVREHWRGSAVFAVVFAPLGCLFRFYVSLLLNSRIPKFPLGTFTANIFGTLVLAMCYDLQRSTNVLAVPVSSFSPASAAVAAAAVGVSRLTGCQVLQGIMDGFCGCTTTVSTWVAELDSLDHEHAYVYGLVTTGVALGLLVVVIGSVQWTVGFGLVVC
ncbi:chromosome condensation protein [Histoplasma capsulatum var. duboisii H88]|uniref:Chromosome condensation protein n=2 Tax=Ajellomyces capsulatus TaxID=5037 RepID=F0UBJ7_AJEC8|nr:chromosome condensation protein [Histoplasma capsulatum H143]EGC43898.1 chromosome condensation protein [Histoplasma capsulatum var. duboisii H88]QSS50062.1 chromosome condensation protein [Histoplasma capsulatum var. duboisii H88]